MEELIRKSLYILTSAALLGGILLYTGRWKSQKVRLYVSATIAAVFLNGSLYGESGIVSSSAGVLIALLVTGIINTLSEKKEESIYIAVPIAALIGPTATILLFSVSIFFTLIQKWTGSERELVPQYFFSIDEDAATAIELDERSALAEIEAKKLLRTDGYSINNRTGPAAYGFPKGPGELMPWSLKLVIAAIIVLFYESGI